MSRPIGIVPVRIGRSLVPVSIEAQTGAETHVELEGKAPRIVVADDLAPDVASREVESMLPEVQKYLARKMLN